MEGQRHYGDHWRSDFFQKIFYPKGDPETPLAAEELNDNIQALIKIVFSKIKVIPSIMASIHWIGAKTKKPLFHD